MERITKQIFKVLFLLLISSALFVTSCDEDDDDDKDPIIGTWVLFELETVEGTMNAADLLAEEISMTVTFTEDEYYAVGNMGGDLVDETGTWERENSTTVIIYHPGEDGSSTLTKEGEYYVVEMDTGVYGKFRKLGNDTIIGTWELFQVDTPEGTFNETYLAEEGISMEVEFTELVFVATGNLGGDPVDETGIWVRQDANHVIIYHPDESSSTLIKEGDYYVVEMDEGMYGKFRKI